MLLCSAAAGSSVGPQPGALARQAGLRAPELKQCSSSPVRLCHCAMEGQAGKDAWTHFSRKLPRPSRWGSAASNHICPGLTSVPLGAFPSNYLGVGLHYQGKGKWALCCSWGGEPSPALCLCRLPSSSKTRTEAESRWVSTSTEQVARQWGGSSPGGAQQAPSNADSLPQWNCLLQGKAAVLAGLAAAFWGFELKMPPGTGPEPQAGLGGGIWAMEGKPSQRLLSAWWVTRHRVCCCGVGWMPLASGLLLPF